MLFSLTAAGILLAPATSGAASSSTATFGTLPSPCGKGHATGATDQGVTNSTINIAYGDDRGFSGSPGLDQEMGDAVKAMIAWCDAQGGINGRKIVGDYYDAAVTNVGSVMTQACKTDFMLVGEGFALDGLAEQTRLGCNLAAVPGFTVSPVVANAYEQYQATPNPANASPVSIAYQGEKLFGSKTQHVGQYDSTLSTQQESMAKAVQAYTTAGWKWVNCPFLVNYNGEANYTPFMQKLQSCGAQIVFDNATPGPTLYGALQAANQIGYNPVWLLDAAEYTEDFAKWNTSGLANKAYVRIGYEPLEAAKVVPAVAEYLSDRQEGGWAHVGSGRAGHVVLPPLGHRGQGVRLHPDPPVHDQPPLEGDELERRRAQCPGGPGQEPPGSLRHLDEARQHQVGAGLPEEAGGLRLLTEVHREEHGIRHRHPVERAGLRHPVRHVVGHQASGLTAPDASPSGALTAPASPLRGQALAVQSGPDDATHLLDLEQEPVMSGEGLDDRDPGSTGEMARQLLLERQRVEPVRRDAGHGHVGPHRAERRFHAASASAHVMVVHRLTQDDVAVRIEPFRQLLTVMLQVGLDRVAATLQRVLFALALPAEALLELRTGAVAEMTDPAGDGQSVDGPVRGLVVVATVKRRVGSNGPDLQGAQRDLIGRGGRADGEDDGTGHTLGAPTHHSRTRIPPMEPPMTQAHCAIPS